jgi:tellurite methyltransferase
MPIEDATYWNQRYQGESGSYRPTARPLLVDHIHLLPKQGLALDVAMGVGLNSGELIEHGLNVIGFDIASAAVKEAKKQFPQVQAAIIDLTTVVLPPQCFDVILNFNYLQRDLWPQYRKAIKPGGLLIFETLTKQLLTIHPETRPEFLLEEGELKRSFSDWDILFYEEGWKKGHHNEKPIASMIARAA